MLPEVFADFAGRRWGREVDPDLVRTTTDVSVAAVEVLRRVIAPGDQVVVMPPVYPPFWDYVREAGGTVTEVPLLPPAGDPDPYDTTAGWRMDLDGIARGARGGCPDGPALQPAQPPRPRARPESLVALARLAAEWDAVVVSDEIHAPLTHADAVFTPFLTCGPEAVEHGSP